jgi:hypothetical protein
MRPRQPGQWEESIQSISAAVPMMTRKLRKTASLIRANSHGLTPSFNSWPVLRRRVTLNSTTKFHSVSA